MGTPNDQLMKPYAFSELPMIGTKGGTMNNMNTMSPTPLLENSQGKKLQSL